MKRPARWFVCRWPRLSPGWLCAYALVAKPGPLPPEVDAELERVERARIGNAADALAVQSLYATAGQSGSHRIVSALRAVESWIREGGAP